MSVTVPATPATPVASAINHVYGSFTISWADADPGVTRYDLQRRVGSGSWTTLNKGTGLTHGEFGVESGSYGYRVRVCKATGCSAYSGILTVDIVRPPSYKCPPNCTDPFGSETGDGSASDGESTDGTSSESTSSEASPDSAPTESTTETAPADGEDTTAATDTAFIDSVNRATSPPVAVIPATAAKFPHPESVPSSPFASPIGDNDIAANGASQVAVIPGTPGIQSSASRAQHVQVNGTRSSNGFRAMHPARPYDLARNINATVHANRATNARALKTGFPALAASAIVTPPAYRLRVAYEYDSWSHLARVKNADANGITYWEAHTSDAAGHVLDEQYGNGVMTTHVYDPRSGLVQAITSSNAAAVAVQSLAYDWDTAGNLTERRDELATYTGGTALTEHFHYDALNRLNYSTLSSTSFSGTNLDLSYDAAGNIATKSGTGTYTYGGTRPHALTSLAKSGGGTDTFTYDANGNLLTQSTVPAEAATQRTIYWTSYNYPRRTEQGTAAVNFFYGPDRQRYKEEIYSGGTLQSRRITVNAYFEKVNEPATGLTTFKHYIRAGAKVIAIHDRKSDFLHETHYLHRDHLGSVDTITKDDGSVHTRTSFDAFGLRRNALNWNDGFPKSSELEQIRDVTSRGYTGHQMIDAVKLVHMNGRVYDPELGRFLSPDPNIPEPGNTQSFNRYSYVHNNPLSFTDPSGFVRMYHGKPVGGYGWGFGFNGNYTASTWVSSDTVTAMMAGMHNAAMAILASAVSNAINQTANAAFAAVSYAQTASSYIQTQFAAYVTKMQDSKNVAVAIGFGHDAITESPSSFAVWASGLSETAGMMAGVIQHSTIRGSGASMQWRAPSYGWYAMKFNGNQHTGGRNAIVATGRIATAVGNALAVVSGVISAYGIVDSYQNGDSAGLVGHSANLAVTGISQIGIGGFVFGVSYSVTSLAIQHPTVRDHTVTPVADFFCYATQSC